MVAQKILRTYEAEYVFSGKKSELTTLSTDVN